MTHFLANEEYPDGYRLEELLTRLRNDLVLRMGKICDDTRPEAHDVLANDVAILGHLTQAIKLAGASTKLLDKAFGPTKQGEPRIGVE